MILMIEQDTRKGNGFRFFWKPFLFKGTWKGHRTWRIIWGWWSLSYYPEPGIKEFFDYVQGNNTQFYRGNNASPSHD